MMPREDGRNAILLAHPDYTLEYMKTDNSNDIDVLAKKIFWIWRALILSEVWIKPT